MNASVIYYTDNQLQPSIQEACQRRLLAAAPDAEIISVSQEPMKFGNNLVFGRAKRCLLTVYKQIVAGLQVCSNDQVFLAEHDVLYCPQRFAFELNELDMIYYNTNVYRMDSEGFFTWQNDILTSNLTAPRSYLMNCLEWRIKKIEDGSRFVWSEPAGMEDNWNRGTYRSDVACIDVRHNNNLTGKRDAWNHFHSLPGWPAFKELKEEIGLQ